MSDPTPEVPETPEDSWRTLALDQAKLLMPHEDYPAAQWLDMVDKLARRDALLAAEDEHPALPLDEALNALSNAFDDLRQRSAEDEHPATPAGWQSVAEQYRTLAMGLGRKLGDDFTHGDLAAWLPADLERMRLQLAAAPVDEHPPTFHVVMGTHLVYPDGRWPETEKHWHVRVVATNGKTLLSSENYTEKRGAVECAHLLADPMGAKVVDDA